MLSCATCAGRLEAEDLIASGSRVEVRCPHCGARGTLGEGLRVARSHSGVDTPPCPKCSAPIAADEGACPKCGLARARFGNFEGEAQVPAAGLESKWSAVLENWESDSGHRSFVEACSAAGAFAYAASCYRGVLSARPDDATAAVQLPRIRRMAEAALLAGSPPTAIAREPQPYRRVILLLGGLIAVMIVVGAYIVVRRSMAPDEPSYRGAPAEAHRR